MLAALTCPGGTGLSAGNAFRFLKYGFQGAGRCFRSLAQRFRGFLPVIVDVWSETCAPCKKLVPVLIQVATKYQGKLRVAELSTQAEPRLLAELSVQATPMILVFDGGVEIGRMAGYRPAGWFDDMIASEFPDLGSKS